MQQSHFIIPKILVLKETLINLPVATNSQIPHLVSANRSHRGKAPHPPSLCERLSNFRMANRQALMKKPIDQDNDPRLKERDEFLDIPPFGGREQANSVQGYRPGAARFLKCGPGIQETVRIGL